MAHELVAARAFLRRRFPAGGRVLCAVSGGLDSMCLLHFLDTWGRANGFSAAAAHFNHRLRGELADRDQGFVEDWCAARGIPCFTGTGDTRALMEAAHLSLEEAARKLRYAFLEETARREGFAAILTAHHADDNAETMLLNLIRGTGTAGLTGIPQVRGNICRPFLRISRETLADYAKQYEVPHVEDETNQEDSAARNILRHHVFPILRDINPRAVENMSFTAGVVARESAALEELASALAEQAVRTGGVVSIACSALLNVPLAVAERAALQLLRAAAGREQDLGAAHVAAVLDLAEQGREDARVSLPYGLIAAVHSGVLTICRASRPPAAAVLERDRPLRWGGYTLTLLENREGTGLALRPGEEPVQTAACEPGARLHLPGTNGARSVKRLCLDQRIPLEKREGLPAIYVGGRLAAVWPLGVDEEFLPVGTACRFIQIIEQPEENNHEK